MPARIRTVKPSFFRHVGLFDAEQETGLPLRVAFAGLWTTCDRDGRFIWRPRELKLDVLPHDLVDFARVLHALWIHGFIGKYRVDGVEYGFIPSWSKHQVINNRESASVLPVPDASNIVHAPGTREARVDDASATREARVEDATATPLVHAPGELELELEGVPPYPPHGGPSDAPPTGDDADEPQPTAPAPAKRSRRKAVIDGETLPKFERFYKAYPRKVDRKAALIEFARINPSDDLVDTMISAIKAQGLREKFDRGEHRFVPHPSTWLHKARWNDEVPGPRLAYSAQVAL
jgi:hypothetical protein